MHARSIVSPDDQRVTFVELFFDLVFVFAVTQVVQVLHDGFGWGAVGRAVLVFWLVWWAWTQFTWALNAADTTHHMVELATLLAVAVAFFMAVAVPDAFRGRALWFAVPYVMVRTVGLTLYGRVAEEAHPSQLAAVRTFCLVSLGGLAAVVMGAVAGGTTQYWAWGLAILLDVIAAGVGGRLEGWDLHPEHFAERHGLIVIIALGESLIVAAGGLVGVPWDVHLAAVAVLAVAVTCAFWWSYFPVAKPELDHALASARGRAQSMLARDVYSLTHFPLLCGVVAYAASVEEAVAHPSAALPLEWRAALAAGLALFVGGMAAATWRCRHRVLWARLIVSTGTALAIVLVALPPLGSLAIAFAGIATIATLEQRGWLAGRAEVGVPEASGG
jgi:low temperature requirement protein LtrA